ncbi:MAG: PH domain-containing protein [Nanohaloarchaea archaeon]|nr:PH domain-containing protein [Candidatus Nanohaloarchaea archaeon]
MKKLEKQILKAWILGSLIFAAFLGFVTEIAARIGLEMPWLGVAVFAVSSVIGTVYSLYRYKNWGYEKKEGYLYLEHGVLRKVKSMVPHVRIQHVDSQRSVMDRVFGLSSVVVYTAGSRGADVNIPGLTPKKAEELQSYLRKVAIESEDEDAV